MMYYLRKLTNNIVKITAGILVVMMLIITIGVISRMVNTPLLGTVELIELTMVLLIAVSLPFAHRRKAHIKVDLFYNNLPEKIKHGLTILSNILSVIVTGIISLVFLKLVSNNLLTTYKTTDLLFIPLLPFKFILGIGFIVWLIYTLIDTLKSLKGGA